MGPSPGAKPPTGAVHTVAVFYWICVLAALYTTVWLLLGAAMEPGGAGWAISLLYLCSRVAGSALPRVSKRLPPLLAMLIVGLLLRNVPGDALRADVQLLGESFEWWSARLRAAALAVTMELGAFSLAI